MPETGESVVQDPAAIDAAQTIYTSATLPIYDLVVHGISNRLAWQCPTSTLLDLYRETLSSNHLEAGVGSGFFLDRARRGSFDRLVLLDINRDCLAYAGRRLAKYRPELLQANLLGRPISALAPFDSIALTYVLHCLPGSLSEKLSLLDGLIPMMRPGAVLFGATILGRGVAPNGPARALMALYNRKGIFNNEEDDAATLQQELDRRFGRADVEVRGCVALFRASGARHTQGNKHEA